MTRFLGTPKVQFFYPNKQEPLVGGKVYTYLAGTMTPVATYPTIADADASTNANANPVILDSRGEANIVLASATKIILKDANDNTVWTEDNLNSGAIGNDVLSFVISSSGVNEVTITNAVTGSQPIIASTGTDTNVGLDISTKKAGTLTLNGGATGTVEIGTTSSGTITISVNTRSYSTISVAGNTSVSSTLSSLTHTVTGALSVSGQHSTGALSVTNNVDFVPVGMTAWYAGSSTPSGWQPCNGAAISRTTFSALFAIIGTTFGVGDGSTTFNLPTSARRVLVGSGGSGTGTLANTVGSTGGAETHTLVTAEIPSHTHSINAPDQLNRYSGGSGTTAYSATSTSTGSTGGSAHNNMMPSLVLTLIIKSR